MRAMWTAASGMKAQQFNIDTVSNNISNVNTTGYKKMRADFKDLMYANMKNSTVADGQGSPVNLQVGHGVMVTGSSRNFENGVPNPTGQPTDVALNGKGFFIIQMPNGEDLRYTRDGNFKFSVDGDTMTLVTSEGYKVLNQDGGEITIENGQKDFTIDENGRITVKDNAGEIQEIGFLGIKDFLNPDGLEAVGSNMFKKTSASGEPIDMDPQDMETKMMQNYLESSNVQIVDEMIKLITAQRAYDINSKSIQTSDEMLQTANNIKR